MPPAIQRKTEPEFPDHLLPDLPFFWGRSGLPSPRMKQVIWIIDRRYMINVGELFPEADLLFFLMTAHPFRNNNSGFLAKCLIASG